MAARSITVECTQIEPSDFSVRIHPIDEEDFRSETNIGQLFGLSDEETHKVIERGLLADVIDRLDPDVVALQEVGGEDQNSGYQR